VERVLSCNVAQHVGEEVLLKGWVHRIRELGKVAFLLLRDRAGIVQVVVDRGKIDIDDLDNETSLAIWGRVREEPRAPGGVEVEMERYEVYQRPVERLPIEVNKKREHWRIELDTILKHRALSLKNPELRAVFKVKAELVWAFREYLRSQGFTEVHTPKIVAAGTEGGTALFRLQYFEQDAFLAQSPQFYKQMLVGAGFERVYEVGFVYRAEEHNTTRHLNEYLSLDYEMGFIDSFQDVMDMETGLLRFMFQHVKETCAEELALYGAEVPEVPEEIPRLRLEEAKRILREHFGKDYPENADLDPEGERLICEYAKEELGCELVFLTHYPVSKRPMYTMPDPENPELTLSFDLIYKGLEITTGGQRIHEYQMLCDNIRKFGLDPQDFDFYLEIFKFGMPPHGGLAIGAERITMQLLNLKNVREAALFPRDRTRLVP